MTTSLEGRAVLITGGGRGLGREYALAAASAGARLLVNDADETSAVATAHAVRLAGGEAVAVGGAVEHPGTAAGLVAECERAFGQIDGFVANAAVLHPGPLVGQPADVIARTIAINLLGAALGAAAAADRMRAAGGGSIVTVVSGAMQGLPDLALYGTTKAGVLGLTLGLALELRGTGVRVNAISPLARTPMSDAMGLPDSAKGGDPSLVAPAVVYLLGDRSRHLTGQVVRFDGQRLGLVAPPRLAATTVERQWWSADGIADALDGELAPHVAPLGLADADAPIVVGPHDG